MTLPLISTPSSSTATPPALSRTEKTTPSKEVETPPDPLKPSTYFEELLAQLVPMTSFNVESHQFGESLQQSVENFQHFADVPEIASLKVANTPLENGLMSEGAIAIGVSQEKLLAANSSESTPGIDMELSDSEAGIVESTVEQTHQPIPRNNQQSPDVSSLNAELREQLEFNLPERKSSTADLPQQETSQQTPVIENVPVETRLDVSSSSQATSLAGKVIQKVVEETMSQLSSAQSKVDSSFSVRLDPPELGEVLVRLKKTEGGIMMRIAAIESTTQQLLEQNETHLSDSLQDHQSELSMELGDRSEFSQTDEFYDWGANESRGSGPSIQSQNTTDQPTIKAKTVSTSPHDFLA